MDFNSLLMWAGSFISGIFLGLFYFGFLWWTLNRLTSSRHPVVITMFGYAARLAIAVLVFYLIIRLGGWLPLIICLAGFILARVILINRWGAKTGAENQIKEGTS